MKDPAVISHQTNPNRYDRTLHVTESGKRLERPHPANADVAEIGQEIVFDMSILDTYRYDGWKPLHYDLLVVSAAIEFADRRWARPVGQRSRYFHIVIPVLDLVAWQRAEVQTHLTEVLRHLTGDNWHFSFVQNEGSSANWTRQRALPFGNNKQFAIAYSDGLDSRCVSGLYNKGDIAVLVRVARNKDRIKRDEHPFDLIPFHVKLKSAGETGVRSRGFKFAAITAIAGHISDVDKIIVPESGQGALGPVLLPLHNIYADYRSHPTFFRKMEKFIKALLGYSVHYEQPRLWNTKGQTISAFLAESGKAPESLLTTRSCWQQRWNARLNGSLRQCGLCAACLLRRMSMHAAGVTEPPETYLIADLTTAHYADAVPRSNSIRLSGTMKDYGSVGARHLQQLADMAGLTDRVLRVHAFEIARAIGASEQDTLTSLRSLLVRHAEEWRGFMTTQGKHSFLNSWIKGGRYG